MNVYTSAACWLVAGLAICGCGTDYAWRSSVPQDMRTVSVPTFRNESDLQEAGAIAARQVLREFQREGTFSVRSSDDAALQVQGTIVSMGGGMSVYDRRHSLRLFEHEIVVGATVSVVDKRRGRVLVDNRAYRATASFASSDDLTTAQRDASGRAMEDLARQIVDDVLSLKLREDAAASTPEG